MFDIWRKPWFTNCFSVQSILLFTWFTQKTLIASKSSGERHKEKNEWQNTTRKRKQSSERTTTTKQNRNNESANGVTSFFECCFYWILLPKRTWSRIRYFGERELLFDFLLFEHTFLFPMDWRCFLFHHDQACVGFSSGSMVRAVILMSCMLLLYFQLLSRFYNLACTRRQSIHHLRWFKNDVSTVKTIKASKVDARFSIVWQKHT